MADKQTVSTKADKELSERLDLIADSKGMNKSEYIRQVLREEVQEEMEDQTQEELLRAVVERQEQLEQKLAEVADEDEVDGVGGISDFLPGGKKDPGPFGALNRASDDE